MTAIININDNVDQIYKDFAIALANKLYDGTTITVHINRTSWSEDQQTAVYDPEAHEEISLGIILPRMNFVITLSEHFIKEGEDPVSYVIRNLRYNAELLLDNVLGKL